MKISWKWWYSSLPFSVASVVFSILVKVGAVEETPTTAIICIALNAIATVLLVRSFGDDDDWRRRLRKGKNKLKAVKDLAVRKVESWAPRPQAVPT
ncbi:hypothetical protein SEA_PUPPER_182 [Gordonia phage Pupper]|uniref:Uncharacterized protein n=1 Tax=Gordonia phage Pupper TaxID=2571249 RepID=A0A4Y6EIV8_9CAUD|nr:hypothetical protein KHQ83_gp095 [Gordonia phage Pupper]QDF18668.1 hypothetical protein SEA_PUPPER_182 [Gordonia phage Pupper]QDF18900.1 hypothetical protein SEA_SCENTAE_181 [Gordonia phage SCentae]